MPDIFIKPDKPAHIHHLAAFCDHPNGITFENQESDEVILLFLRRHPITNLSWVFVATLLILTPLLVYTFLPSIPLQLFSSLRNEFVRVFLIFYYLIVFSFILVQFLDWYFNISLITQKRIVDIDFSDLVYHDVAVTKLNLVEDVNYTQVGFIRSLLNYGDVFVQTAGEKLHFDFLAVPQPTRVINIIQNLIGKGSHD